MAGPSLLFLLTHARDLAYNQLELEFHQADLHGLAPSHAEIIMLLQNKGRLTMQEIARAIHRDKSTLTVLINKLERKGFVKRVPGLADRRRTYIEPQASCKIVARDIKKIYQRINTRLKTCLPATDRKRLAGHLQALTDGLLARGS